jgi:dihydrofolate synthase/folylpolyglutamate synthase
VVNADDPWDGLLALAGAHQRENAAVALTVLRLLPPPLRPSADAIARAFATTVVPGRYDRRGRWLFDVAHNLDGVQALLATLAEEPVPRPVHALVGILGDKPWAEMIDALLPAVATLWFTDPPSAPPERRLDPARVATRFGDRVRIAPDFAGALDAAARGAGTVLVTGSFHTVGDAMARLPGFRPLG